MSSSQLRLACATAKSSSWEMWDRRAWRTRASGSLKELMWMAHLTSAHVPEFRDRVTPGCKGGWKVWSLAGGHLSSS